jgi:hypothetical protein
MKKFFIKKFITFHDLGEEIVRSLFRIEVEDKLLEIFKIERGFRWSKRSTYLLL